MGSHKFYLGTSDIIAIQMAFNRLRSIRKIRIYSKGNRLVISFRRKTKLKSFPRKVLAQVIAAFLVSFIFHIPFFLDKSGAGACDYHKHLCKGKSIQLIIVKIQCFLLFNACLLYIVLCVTLFAGTQDHGKWQTNHNCKIYLWIYFSLMKYVPAFLIAVINVVIAWKN